MPWTTKLNNLTKKHFNLQINDLVLVKQLPKNKFCTHFSSHTYQIAEEDARMIKVEMGFHTIPLPYRGGKKRGKVTNFRR